MLRDSELRVPERRRERAESQRDACCSQAEGSSGRPAQQTVDSATQTAETRPAGAATDTATGTRAAAAAERAQQGRGGRPGAWWLVEAAQGERAKEAREREREVSRKIESRSRAVASCQGRRTSEHTRARPPADATGWLDDAALTDDHRSRCMRCGAKDALLLSPKDDLLSSPRSISRRRRARGGCPTARAARRPCACGPPGASRP